MAHKDSDLKKIKKLIDVMKENDLVELEIKHDNDKIFLKRSQPQQVHIPMAMPMVGHGVAGGAVPQPVIDETASSADEGLVDINSPIVGTFYATPSPDSQPFVEVGSDIEEDTVICVIEAMKVMNEIKAETSGKIVKILAKSGQAVEYGQALFKVKPD